MPLWYGCSTRPACCSSSSCSTVLALVVRRRLLVAPRRHLRAQPPRPARRDRAAAGCSGSGRYSGEQLEWFRIFSLSPRPKRAWERRSLTYDGAVSPRAPSSSRSTPTTWSSTAGTADRRRSSSRMTRASLTGFQAWLEVAPARDGLVALTVRAAGRCGPATRSRRSSRSTASCSPRWSPGSPTSATGLDLDNGALGLLLLAIAAGSVLALPSAGRLIQRLGRQHRGPGRRRRRGRRAGACAALGAGPLGVGAGRRGRAVRSTASASGVWDVAMNVEGAEVERRLGRSIMSRFHAAFSFGTIAGAGLGVAVTAAGRADAGAPRRSSARWRSCWPCGRAARVPRPHPEHEAADRAAGAAPGWSRAPWPSA